MKGLLVDQNANDQICLIRLDNYHFESSLSTETKARATEDFLLIPAVDTEIRNEIMTPEEVAQFLRKSTSWVYKHCQELGGVKLGGSIFFPKKEELYERLFGKRQRVEVRLHPERSEVHSGMVQHQKTGKRGRGKKAGRTPEATADREGGDNTDRYNLLGTG